MAYEAANCRKTVKNPESKEEEFFSITANRGMLALDVPLQQKVRYYRLLHRLYSRQICSCGKLKVATQQYFRYPYLATISAAIHKSLLPLVASFLREIITRESREIIFLYFTLITWFISIFYSRDLFVVSICYILIAHSLFVVEHVA